MRTYTHTFPRTHKHTHTQTHTHTQLLHADALYTNISTFVHLWVKNTMRTHAHIFTRAHTQTHTHTHMQRTHKSGNKSGNGGWNSYVLGV